MFESADGLLTPCTRQNDGRLGMVTVSDSVSDPAGTIVDSTTDASPANVLPFNVAHAAPASEAVVSRSGLCAETSITAVRNAAAPKNDPYFSIMAASVSQIR